MGKLDGRVAIVTGAGQGIGRGIALALAKEGASIFLVGRTLAKLDTVAAEITDRGGVASAGLCNVGVEAEVKETVARVISDFGAVDVLVNNAQSFGAKTPEYIPLEDFPEDIWDVTFQSGLKGTLYFSKAVFPHMRDRGGRIVNLVSPWGITGYAGAAAYNACKEAIRALTRTAAREWGKYGINVNAISPYNVETEALEAHYELHPRERDMVLRQVPVRRAGHPEKDVGRLVVFLASDDAGYLTGQTFHVDGGYNMHA